MTTDHNEAVALHRWAVIAEATPARLRAAEPGTVANSVPVGWARLDVR